MMGFVNFYYSGPGKSLGPPGAGMLPGGGIPPGGGGGFFSTTTNFYANLPPQAHFMFSPLQNTAYPHPSSSIILPHMSCQAAGSDPTTLSLPPMTATTTATSLQFPFSPASFYWNPGSSGGGIPSSMYPDDGSAVSVLNNVVNPNFMYSSTTPGELLQQQQQQQSQLQLTQGNRKLNESSGLSPYLDVSY
ncbi:unnamed protein product [Trichobilharzia regenti]|nr:unnamed protein product [Trichobilharzia regenti]